METCELASIATMKNCSCFDCPFGDCIYADNLEERINVVEFRHYIVTHWTHVSDLTLSLLLGITRRTLRRHKFERAT